MSVNMLHVSSLPNKLLFITPRLVKRLTSEIIGRHNFSVDATPKHLYDKRFEVKTSLFYGVEENSALILYALNEIQ
ncbi:hypothetical protein C6502_13670 [Candidatus Poribacteria bacterium]|nr:MAG: hypothetical protein C6502_13670 [Candidatus Poribacteria bacterium]